MQIKILCIVVLCIVEVNNSVTNSSKLCGVSTNL